MKTAQEFYDFFNAIPDEQWTCGALNRNNTKCALSHLGVVNGAHDYVCPTPEIKENVENLASLFRFEGDLKSRNNFEIIYSVNDVGIFPKQNMLNALQHEIEQ